VWPCPRRHGRPSSCPIIGSPRPGVKLRWAKLKALLRGLRARTLGALEAALATLVDAIAAAAGFFRHCGYARRHRDDERGDQQGRPYAY
jgi:hypothetical protein